MLCSLQLISKCFMHAYASIHAHTHRANMINVTSIESLSGNTIVVVPLILSYQLFHTFEIWHNQKVQKKSNWTEILIHSKKS